MPDTGDTMTDPNLPGTVKQLADKAGESQTLMTIIVLVFAFAGVAWVFAKWMLPELVRWQEQKTKQAESLATMVLNVRVAAECNERTTAVQKSLVEAQERVLKMCECEHERWQDAADQQHER